MSAFFSFRSDESGDRVASERRRTIVQNDIIDAETIEESVPCSLLAGQ
jgi:hypothetical protein